MVHFVMEGGVYAYPYVRGGGDQGTDWAKAGKRNNKVNAINDFIAAAEYLISNRYTMADKIASCGASHGAMLVAAAAIKRPDLFKIVAPIAGTYDLLRQESFSVGGFNTHEYGTVKNEEDFNNMYSYSPYHNIDTTINYPSMLIHCAENDERVTPFQSYKFVARLQANPSQRNPIMMIEEKKSGHKNVGLDNMSLAVIMHTLISKK